MVRCSSSLLSLNATLPILYAAKPFNLSYVHLYVKSLPYLRLMPEQHIQQGRVRRSRSVPTELCFTNLYPRCLYTMRLEFLIRFQDVGKHHEIRVLEADICRRSFDAYRVIWCCDSYHGSWEKDECRLPNESVGLRGV